MGTSGTGLFSDDTASDVREDFLTLLRGGLNSEQAVERIEKDWADSIKDCDDGPIFWLALAATQWAYGCLNDEVKRRAIEVIDNGDGLSRWTGRFLVQRRRVLTQLRTKLQSPQPALKLPRKQKPVSPPSRYEVVAPDGLGKAVAFSMSSEPHMQVYLERIVGTSRGGGSIFVAECRYDSVDLAWLPGGALQVTYPQTANVQQRSEKHFYCGETIPIVYRLKPA